MAGRPLRRARLNGATGRSGGPVTLNELKLIVGPLRARFPDAEFDVDEERTALRTRLLFYDARLRREIQQYLQARSYVVIVTDEEVDEIGDHGYPTGRAERVSFLRLGHAHATTAHSNGATGRPPRPLTDEDRLDILGEALDNGLPTFAGACGATAIAIRDVLFDGRAEVVAAVNRHFWRQGRAVGHVGVRDSSGTIWDGEGTYEGDAVEEFMAWGMLDFSDPDHSFTDEEQAEEVLLLEGRDAMRAARQMQTFGPALDPGPILRAARASVVRRPR